MSGFSSHEAAQVIKQLTRIADVLEKLDGRIDYAVKLAREWIQVFNELDEEIIEKVAVDETKGHPKE